MVKTAQDLNFIPLKLEGKTLMQHRNMVLQLTRKTGHYAGLKNLKLKESSPILYNKMFSRLRAGIVNARETAKRIAASPIRRTRR